MAKKMNPFDKFKQVIEKKVVIDSLDGYEITYRDLTVEEDDIFNTRMLKVSKAIENGDDVDVSDLAAIKYDKLSALLVEPKMTANQLKGMYGANDVLVEIISKTQGVDGVDEKGNS